MFGLTEFSIFSILFKLIFILMVGMVIAKFIEYCLQWNQNRQSPKLTVFATVVSKRTSVIYLSETDHHYTSRRYFVTFEVASGDQMEFCVSSHEYKMLNEEDQGLLSFQGTGYLDFEREH